MPTTKVVNDLLSKIRKKYGDNAATLASQIPRYDVASSGSLSLDYITGIGGLPTTRVIEYIGAEGTGKTTLAFHTINEFLKKFPDRLALFLDVENRVTADWAANFVDDMDRLLVVWPDNIEQATDIYVDAVSGGEICIVALDSIGGAPTKRQADKSAEIANFGGNALGVKSFAQHAAVLSNKKECLTIGINQVREDMSGYNRIMGPGGMAWKHAVSLRVALKRGQDKFHEKIDGEEIQVGYNVILRTLKNSLGSPFRITQYRFYNERCTQGFGVDKVDEVSRLSRLSGLVNQRGAWLYHPDFPDGKISGLANFEAFLRSSVGRPTLDVLEQQLKDKISRREKIEGAAESFLEDDSEEHLDNLGSRLNKALIDLAGGEDLE